MSDFLDHLNEDPPADQTDPAFHTGSAFFRVPLENQGWVSGVPTFKSADPAVADRLCVIRELGGVRKRVLRLPGGPGGSLQDRFVVEENINCGSWGKVKRGVDLVSGKPVAIKFIYREMAGTIDAEVAGMRRVDSDHVLKCLGRYDGVLFPSLNHQKCRDYCALVMEYCRPVDLYGFIRYSSDFMSEDTVRLYSHQLLKAFEACHEVGCYHLDAKVDNILLDTTDAFGLKLGDFGLCRFDDPATDPRAYKGSRGTKGYTCPEMYSGEGYYDPRRADVWAAGCIVFALTFNNLPFGPEPCVASMNEYYRYYLGRPMQYLQSANDRCTRPVSPACLNFISLLLTADPGTRPSSISALFQHPFLSPLSLPGSLSAAVLRSIPEMASRQQATETPASIASQMQEFATQNAKLNTKVPTFSFGQNSVPTEYRCFGQRSSSRETKTKEAQELGGGEEEEDCVLPAFDAEGTTTLGHVLWLPLQFGHDSAKPGRGRTAEAIAGILDILGGVQEVDLKDSKVSKRRVIKTCARTDDQASIRIDLFKVAAEEGLPDAIVAVMSRRGGAMSAFFKAAKSVEERIEEAWKAASKD